VRRNSCQISYHTLAAVKLLSAGATRSRAWERGVLAGPLSVSRTQALLATSTDLTMPSSSPPGLES